MFVERLIAMQDKSKSKTGRKYPKEFRDKAVRLIQEGGYHIKEVAKQLGCSRESIRKWKQAANATLDPEIAKRMEREENETQRLRKENERLREELEILKKAAAYFAKEMK